MLVALEHEHPVEAAALFPAGGGLKILYDIIINEARPACGTRT